MLVGIISIFLAACNSSSGHVSSESSDTISTSDASIVPTFAISGRVVDGYISGATVCLDLNSDGSCGNNEPLGTTDENGVFYFSSLEIDSNLFVPVLAYGGINTSIDEEFQGQLKNIIDTSDLEYSSEIMISPLTDLVATSFLSNDAKNILALNDSKSAVSEALGVTIVELDNNPMQDIALFSTSQLLQHAKYLILTSAKKSLNSSMSQDEELLLQDIIKEELINQQLDVYRILTVIEVELNSIIPTNEKVFILNQIQELKTALSALSQDVLLDAVVLRRLQKSLYIKMQEANRRLENSTDGATIEVVTLNITAKSLVQSSFDKSEAVLDEQACSISNDYNWLSHTSFSPNKSEDTENGLSLKSEYGFGESIQDNEIIIYYPNLTEPKTDENTIVFGDEYYFVFDKAWVQNSKKTLYVKTPKDENGIYSCYRFELNSASATNISRRKVFRYLDI